MKLTYNNVSEAFASSLGQYFLKVTYVSFCTTCVFPGLVMILAWQITNVKGGKKDLLFEYLLWKQLGLLFVTFSLLAACLLVNGN